MSTAHWDLHTDQVSWQPGVYRLLGRDPGLGPLSLDQLLRADRPALRRVVAAALLRGQAESGLVPIERPGDEPRRVQVTGEPLLDQDGRVTALRMSLRQLG
ncbi:PAS domain-containing protein [Kitasatospora sp. NPDC002040]|uniref:PAS domain-containing protein n=1 Tax=Kitasatospora sp. NPDC002040 TaxID=3154661 RepID=UPI003333D66F